MGLSTTQLTITNGALRHLAQRKLTDVLDATEPARVMQDIWADGFMDDCLSQGQWIFAITTQAFFYDPDIVPEFGPPSVFEKPADWIRTTGVWSDQMQTQPLIAYKDGAGVWNAFIQTIYVSYVSNLPQYGGTLTSWPETMVRWAECYLAWRGCFRITQDHDLEDKLFKKQEKLLIRAKSLNAQANPTTFPPGGSWLNARMGGWGRSNPGGGGWL